ncbi:hypothetical protein FRC05_005084 [Tulasnella sp. 425]|nr:hypothetical protein FRC05_005084 [Tulasnella sp. 425]
MTQPSLPLGESLTIGGHVVRVERFLRSEEKLKDYYLESYQVTARASTDKTEGSWKPCTLRKALSVTEALKDACESEIQLSSLLTKNGHPNVVQLLDHYVVSCAAVGDTPRWDVFYLFAESEVRTLADLLEEHHRLGTHIPEERVLRIGIDVVDAVTFLHRLRPPLLHRDIRLSSVVETVSGSFKLVSFISAAFPLAYGFSQDQLSAVYEDLECFTDRDCRSPEMTEVQYEEGVTEKSDIWCIGDLLHLLCYHQHPPRGHIDGKSTPVPNSGTDYPAVQRLLDAILQDDPHSRPTAANLQQSLRQALGVSQLVARNDPHLNFPSSLRELLTMPRRPYCPRPIANFTPAWESSGEGHTSTNPNDEEDPEDADMESMIDWISPQPVGVSTGSLGDIFEGHHRIAGKVALKRLRGDRKTKTRQLKLLESERAIWPRLGHPHILRFMGTLMREESIYLVSPFTANGTILTYLEAYPNANRIKLLCETADAVHYLHTQGIVHGNIRGECILIDDGNHALLRDFELSRLEGTKPNTSSGVFGSLRWMGPELLNGEPRSFSSDVYSFSMTMTEVLTGEVPFCDISHDHRLIVAVLVNKVRPSKIPQHSATGISYENVWEVAEACWAPETEDRMPMSDVLKRLREDPSLESDSHRSFEDGITSISQEPVKTNGGFGNIFLGYHKTAGQVALKCPRLNNEDTIRRFTREARLWQELKHQHVLPLLGMFNRGLVLYIASPFISTGNLAEYAVTSSGAERIRLLCETADALQYLHTQGFIHGDVKGSNVLIGDRCQALLCDFGLTRECDTATSIGLHGHGTVRWQSPELLEESSKSMASDAYAFGMTIAEVLTGQAPFNHIKANAAVILAVLGKHERPKQEPQLCPVDGYSYVASWAVAAACWATAPEDRISMTEAFSRLNSSREEA